MERNAALKQPFRLEENSDAGLLSCQYVTGPCLYQQKCPAPNPLNSITNLHISHKTFDIISDICVSELTGTSCEFFNMIRVIFQKLFLSYEFPGESYLESIVFGPFIPC